MTAKLDIHLYQNRGLWFVHTQAVEKFSTPAEATKRLDELLEVFGAADDLEVSE